MEKQRPCSLKLKGLAHYLIPTSRRLETTLWPTDVVFGQVVLVCIDQDGNMGPLMLIDINQIVLDWHSSQEARFLTQKAIF